MKETIHLIGSAHLDPVWLWTYEEGLAEIKATFRSALDRLNEFDDFVFTCSSASYYLWVEQNAPELFAEIAERVREGRWAPVGGWWVQPDCNLPNGESFARHALYSQRYYQEKFGVTCTVGYNVDSFGHNGMLPQILRQSGMDSYVFMRPEEHEKHIPWDLFEWESPDGSRVKTFRLPNGYACGRKEGEKLDALLKRASEQGTGLMLFYGVGNHGGGPTIKGLREWKRLMEAHKDRSIRFSSPVRFFADEAFEGKELPVLRGDLQHHAPGCYSAHAEVKRMNRLAENRLYSAEAFSVLSHQLTGLPYPSAALSEAFKTVLFNQFHDILGGCSIKEAYDDYFHSQGSALHTASLACASAIQKISWSIDTMGGETSPIDKQLDWQLWYPEQKGAPLVVFNPLSFPRQADVTVNAYLKRVVDEEGLELPVQTVRSSRTNGLQKWDSVFKADIPALGYRLFWGFREEEGCPDTRFAPFTFRELPKGEAVTLENDRVRVEFDPYNGSIRSLTDREGRSYLAGPGAMGVVIDETEFDTWAHGIRKFDREIGRFTDASFTRLEDGPVRKTLRVETRYGGSALRQDFTLHPGSEEVEIHTLINFHEQHKLIKLSFPAACREPEAVYSMPYGYLKKPCNGEEEPAQAWAAVRDAREDALGVALLNDGKYSYSMEGNDLRLTIARGSIYADHFGVRDALCAYMDQGEKEFRLTLLPFHGPLPAARIARLSQQLNIPVSLVMETYHHGSLPASSSALTLKDENILVTALKLSEDLQGYILRLSETKGESGKTEATLYSRTIAFSYRPFEVKSFYFPHNESLPVREVNFLEYDFAADGQSC